MKFEVKKVNGSGLTWKYVCLVMLLWIAMDFAMDKIFDTYERIEKNTLFQQSMN